jgi:hypothetical protein
MKRKEEIKSENLSTNNYNIFAYIKLLLGIFLLSTLFSISYTNAQGETDATKLTANITSEYADNYTLGYAIIMVENNDFNNKFYGVNITLFGNFWTFPEAFNTKDYNFLSCQYSNPTSGVHWTAGDLGPGGMRLSKKFLFVAKKDFPLKGNSSIKENMKSPSFAIIFANASQGEKSKSDLLADVNFTTDVVDYVLGHATITVANIGKNTLQQVYVALSGAFWTFPEAHNTKDCKFTSCQFYHSDSGVNWEIGDLEPNQSKEKKFLFVAKKNFALSGIAGGTDARGNEITKRLALRF